MNSYTNSQEYNCGVLIENCLLKDSKGNNVRTAFVGQIVKITGDSDNGEVWIKMLKDKNETWESTSFCCKKNQIAPIRESLMLFVAAISSPQDRVKLVKNKEKCHKLMNLTKDMTVAVSFSDDVALGVIKYIGIVKSMGKCFGIHLHEKRNSNKCEGSYAGVQYFNCSPGYGTFTTIDKINPLNMATSNGIDKKSELDFSLEKSISDIFLRDKEIERPRNYEEIITKYGEYPKISNKSTTYIRNSLSLQNISDIDKTTNSNNDFDDNSIIPPDKTYLIHESDSKKKIKNKSEMDLIDIVGNSSYNNHENYAEQNGCPKKLNSTKSEADVIKQTKNKIIAVKNHVLENGTATKKKITNDFKVVGGSKSKSFLYNIFMISYLLIIKMFQYILLQMKGVIKNLLKLNFVHSM